MAEKEKSDCTLYLNSFIGDSEDHADECCSYEGIVCDNEGYIKSMIK